MHLPRAEQEEACIGRSSRRWRPRVDEQLEEQEARRQSRKEEQEVRRRPRASAFLVLPRVKEEQEARRRRRRSRAQRSHGLDCFFIFLSRDLNAFLFSI